MAFTITGGARVGWVHASWPFAKLSASEGSLVVSGALLGSFAFAPSEVVALEPYGLIPLLGRGIRIVHAHPGYPSKIVFWVFGDPDRVIARIREAGFVPSCPAAAGLRS